jgi:hypothetical protein
VYCRSIDFTGTCLLWFLQIAVFQQLEFGGEGRNRSP